MDFGSAAHEHHLKQYIISLLVQGAQADHDFSVIEKKYLSYAAKSLGMPESEVAAIRLNPTAYEMSPPPSEQERMNALYFLHLHDAGRPTGKTRRGGGLPPLGLQARVP